MTALVDRLVSDRLWAIVQPLLPPPPRPPYGGRHRTIPDRNCFAAIRQRGLRQRARQARGTTSAQIRSIVASLGPSSTWSARVVGFR